MEKDMFYVNDLQLEELNCSSEQLHGYVNPSWESSIEQAAQFESALSSIVSSPAASSAAYHADSFVIRELIGRLGSAGEVSPPAYSYNSSANTSCYNTPLNSPPKLNLGATGRHRGLAPLPSDPGFAERAARNSCFGSQSYGGMDLDYRSLAKIESSGNLSRVSSSHSLRGEIERAGNGREASVSDQVPAMNELNARKRKAIPKSKPKDKDLNVASQKDDSDVKKSKTSENGGNEKDCQKAKVEEKQKKDSPKPPEPPKDYIHVRARRGQATDSHSLAERVRREKISERMKLLQDLVPGCSKVTGKAVMLDEIINYVQSLQRQVEFLSMKLATINPGLDFNIEALLSKEVLQPNQFLSRTAYPFDPSAATYPFGHQNNLTMQLPAADKLVDTTAQFAGAWDNDLQSMMQMNFEQNQELAFSFQNCQDAGSLPPSNMKVEL